MDDSDFVPITRKPSVFPSSSKQTSSRNVIKSKVNNKVKIESDHLLPHANDNKCYICNKDLSHLNEIRKSLHINTCLDSQEAKSKLDVDTAKWANTLDCPMCGEPLQPGPYRAAHAKRCGKKHNVSAARLLVLMETQSKIAEMKKKTGMAHTKLAPPKLEVKKPTRHKDEPRSTFEEQMKLALAMSASLNTAVVDSVKNVKDDAPIIKPGKCHRKSYSFYELEPRSCKCAVFEQIQENFLKRFKVKHYKDFAEMMKNRSKRSAALLGDVNKCIRKLERLERLADDYGRYASVGGDCKVLCKNGEAFKAHRFIINARAPKLAQLIDGSECLKLDNYSASSLRCYFQFLTTSSIEWTRVEEPEILNLVKSYGPEELEIMFKQSVGIMSENTSNNFEENAAIYPTSSDQVHELDAEVHSDFREHSSNENNSNLKASSSSNAQPIDSVQITTVKSAEQCSSTVDNGCSDDELNNENNTIILTDDDGNDPSSAGNRTSVCHELNLSPSKFQENADLTFEKQFAADNVGRGGSGASGITVIGKTVVDRTDREVASYVNNDEGTEQPTDACNLSVSPDVFYLSSDDEKNPQGLLEAAEVQCFIGQEPNGEGDKCCNADMISNIHCNADIDDGDDLVVGESVTPEKWVPSLSSSISSHPRLTPRKRNRSNSLSADLHQEFFLKSNGVLLSPILKLESLNNISGNVPSSEFVGHPRNIRKHNIGSNGSEELSVTTDVNRRRKRKISDKDENPKTSTPLIGENLIAKRLRELGSNVKVIKTTDITPVPLYDRMNDNELKQELAKYGVRPLGKKKAIAILKKIYEQTHPLVIMDKSPISSRVTGAHEMEEHCNSVQQLKPRVSFSDRFDQEAEEILADCTLNVSLEEDKIREESAFDLMEDEDDNNVDNDGILKSNEEHNDDQEPLPKDIDGMQRALLRWLQHSDNEQLYNHLLTLNPVTFDEFYDRLSRSDSATAAIPKKALIEILDRLHITFKLPDIGWKRKNQKTRSRQQKRK